LTVFADAGPADIAPGACASREVAGQRLLVARTGDGRLFAVSALCSHAQLPMEGARVRAASIVCPHHGARFCLASGRVLGPPAIEPIAAFPARERGGRIEVMLL